MPAQSNSILPSRYLILDSEILEGFLISKRHTLSENDFLLKECNLIEDREYLFDGSRHYLLVLENGAQIMTALNESINEHKCEIWLRSPTGHSCEAAKVAANLQDFCKKKSIQFPLIRIVTDDVIDNLPAETNAVPKIFFSVDASIVDGAVKNGHTAYLVRGSDGFRGCLDQYFNKQPDNLKLSQIQALCKKYIDDKSITMAKGKVFQPELLSNKKDIFTALFRAKSVTEAKMLMDNAVKSGTIFQNRTPKALRVLEAIAIILTFPISLPALAIYSSVTRGTSNFFKPDSEVVAGQVCSLLL